LRHLGGALGGLIDVAGDLVGGRALLFHRGGDGRGDLVDVVDGLADAENGVGRLVGGGLHRADMVGDLGGGLGGLLGQRAIPRCDRPADGQPPIPRCKDHGAAAWLLRRERANAPGEQPVRRRKAVLKALADS
jgi:hypothetical protein